MHATYRERPPCAGCFGPIPRGPEIRSRPENDETPLGGAFEVGRGGIEPPTLGLRVPCSAN